MPEINAGTCMMKYFRIEHPEIFRRFRIENFAKIGRGMYLMIVDYINGIVNGGTLISQYDDVDSDRIASKIAQITSEKQTHWRPQPKHQRERSRTNGGNFENSHAEAFGLQRAPLYDWNDFNLMTPFAHDSQFENGEQQQRRVQRHQAMGNFNRISQRSMNGSDGSHVMRQLHRNSQHSRRVAKNAIPDDNRSRRNDNVMYVGPRQFPDDMNASFDELDDIDPDANINLNNKTAEEEADSLFDIEPMILESMGIDPKNIKKYSPVYCAKEYSMDVIKRITQNLLLAE